MLPLLLFELTWKAVWLVAFAFPRWLDGHARRGDADHDLRDLARRGPDPLVIPWRYVWANYVARPGDPWALAPRRRRGEATPEEI